MGEALNIFYEMGVKLVHGLWRKLEKDKNPDEADGALNVNGFDLIVEKRYKLAQKLLQFGIDLRGHSSELIRLMMVVNFANAYSLGGEQEKGDRNIG